MPHVTATRREYDEKIAQWTRCRDAAGGGDGVKAKETEYLPPLDSHRSKPAKYQEYLTRALYYNATGRTVQGLAGSVFQKAPVVTASPATLEHTKDITLTGEPLEHFGLHAVKEYLTTGRFGILVDMADEEAVEPRPYWVGYRAEDIINWRHRRLGGDAELVFVVLKESRDVLDLEDEFVVKHEDQYRVLRLVDDVYSVQVYTKKPRVSDKEKDEWEAQEAIIPYRRGVALNFIPFALPWAIVNSPIQDLADVNLSHYRGSADLKHGLHFTALPTPWVSGQSGASGKPLSIGSGVAWSLDAGGQAGMLEFSGSGLGAIRQDQSDMQKMMASLGARLIEEQSVRNETDKTASMRNAGDHASLRLVVQLVEQLLTFALQVHEWWLGTTPLVSGVPASVVLNKDFFAVNATSEEVKTLMALLQSDSISYATFYERLTAGGWTREGVDAEAEQKEISTQQVVRPEPLPLPGAPGPATPPGEDDDEDVT